MSRGRSRPRLILFVLFVCLLAAFAAGIWGTILKPSAYEVRGTVMARPAANLLLVRHDPIPELGMKAMELMAIFADPAVVDRAAVHVGDHVRLAVRAEQDGLTLVWIDKRD